MNSFDIMTTATLRPELLKRTFDSHIKYLFGDYIKKANLIINIDRIGANDLSKTLDNIIDYLDSIPFKSITINTPKYPSFSRAFCWCLGQLSSKYVFNLEEDWEMKQKLCFDEMIDLFESDSSLVHLRLSCFKSDGSSKMKNWNKFIHWNGKYFEVSRDLRGTIGWAGHPSLNKTSFLMYFASLLNPESNPEKQIKGAHPIILNSKFGVFHPKEACDSIIKDLGRQWMKEHGYAKKGTKAFFTEWTKEEKEDE